MTAYISLAVTWVLVAFFLVGGIINAVAPESIRKDYARWKYPAWFHWITAASELSTSALLAYDPTRLWGVMSGSCVMFFALATLLYYREMKHAIAPTAVIIMLGVAYSYL